MNNIEMIYNSTQFIEQNLKNNIMVKDIADHVGYSIYYFSRLFNQITGLSPYEYLIKRRLSLAVNKLITTEDKIIDIALHYQFNNPETFSRAFYKMFNLLPSKLKTSKIYEHLIIQQPLSKQFLNYINQEIFKLKYDEINENAFTILGYLTTENNKNALLDELNKQNGNANNNYYILYFNPLQSDKHILKLIGYKNKGDQTPDNTVRKLIPAQRYMKFKIQATHYNLNYLFQYLYQIKLKQYYINKTQPYIIEVGSNLKVDDLKQRTFWIPIS
jgi:AraC family transcriptional regulator